jgi:hypothetical protein
VAHLALGAEGLGMHQWQRELRLSSAAEVWRRGVTGRGRVYHYARPFRVWQLLNDRKLTLVQPECWADPFEQWWCQQLFRPGSQLQKVVVYGLCWTTVWGDEPFWRLHACRCPPHPDDAPGLPALRITCTVENLLDALKKAVTARTAKAFIGDVDYSKGRANLEKEAKRIQREEKEIAKTVATALHLKRPAFASEREVRMLWIEVGDRKVELCRVDIEPLDLIDEVMIGPARSTDGTLVAELRDRLLGFGIPDHRIRESSLYHHPSPR